MQPLAHRWKDGSIATRQAGVAALGHGEVSEFAGDGEQSMSLQNTVRVLAKPQWNRRAGTRAKTWQKIKVPGFCSAEQAAELRQQLISLRTQLGVSYRSDAQTWEGSWRIEQPVHPGAGRRRRSSHSSLGRSSSSDSDRHSEGNRIRGLARNPPGELLLK